MENLQQILVQLKEIVNKLEIILDDKKDWQTGYTTLPTYNGTTNGQEPPPVVKIIN